MERHSSAIYTSFACARLRKEAVEEEYEDYDDQDSLDSVVIEDSSKPWIERMHIKRTDSPFKLDSAADVSIMNETTFPKMERKPHLPPSPAQVTSAGGRLSIKGEVFTKTVVNGEQFKFHMVVVRNRVGSSLVSRNVVQKMGLHIVCRNVAQTMGYIKRCDEITYYSTSPPFCLFHCLTSS